MSVYLHRNNAIDLSLKEGNIGGEVTFVIALFKRKKRLYFIFEV